MGEIFHFDILELQCSLVGVSINALVDIFEHGFAVLSNYFGMGIDYSVDGQSETITS